MIKLCILALAASLWLAPQTLLSQQGDWSSYAASQMPLAIQALNDPHLATKMEAIWWDLHQYSNEAYAVIPVEQFHGGQAIPGDVILFDLSIAEEPNDSIARFFLAHEWGHQHYGDPYTLLSPVGRFQMALGGSAVEDRADKYATAFMKSRGYNVDGVVKFFCALPQSPPGDSHSDGRTRAANVSQWYWKDQAPADPCNATSDAGEFKATLNKILAEVPNNFESFKDNESHPGTWVSNTKFQSAATCSVWGPPSIRFTCLFIDQQTASLIDQLKKTLDMQKWSFDDSDNNFHSDKDYPYSSDDIRIVVGDAPHGARISINPPHKP